MLTLIENKSAFTAVVSAIENGYGMYLTNWKRSLSIVGKLNGPIQLNSKFKVSFAAQFYISYNKYVHNLHEYESMSQ